jgi:hypothetical protein
MDSRVMSQLNTKLQRIEPPRRQDRQEEKGRLSEMKPRKSGIDLSFSLSPALGELGVLAVQFFDGIDRFQSTTLESIKSL